MTISWANSDGQTGIAENAYEFAMQTSAQETKSNREELTPQDRINQAFGEGPTPEVKDQNAPYNWGMGDDLNNLGTQPDAPADAWEKQHGPSQNVQEVGLSAKNESFGDYLERRFPSGKPYSKSKLEEFLGHGLLMPPPDKPESEWTAKEHIGVMLSTAISGMGAGMRMPKITSGMGARSPVSFDYPMDFKNYYPANNANKKGGVTFREGEKLTTETIPQQQQAQDMRAETIKSAAVRIDGKIFTGTLHSDAVANAAKALGRTVENTGEGGFITSTGRYVGRKEANQIADKASQLKENPVGTSAQYGELVTENLKPSKIKWPEGWGSKMPEGNKFAAADYPHVQRAFKDAMESGATSVPEIVDHMVLNGTPTTPGIVQSLRKKAGLTGTKAEEWSTEKQDAFMELVKSGKTTSEITKEMGITRGSVESKIRRIREDNPDFERTFAARDTMSTRIDQVRELAKQGLPANAIAEKLDRSGAYVRMLASGANINLPRDPKSLGGGARKKIEKGDWQKALQDRLNK